MPSEVDCQYSWNVINQLQGDTWFCIWITPVYLPYVNSESILVSSKLRFTNHRLRYVWHVNKSQIYIYLLKWCKINITTLSFIYFKYLIFTSRPQSSTKETNLSRKFNKRLDRTKVCGIWGSVFLWVNYGDSQSYSYYRLDTVNSNTVNLKFHLIQTFY